MLTICRGLEIPLFFFVLFGTCRWFPFFWCGLYFCFLPFPSARVYWFSCPMYAQCAAPAAGTIFTCSLVLSPGHCHPPVLPVIAVSVIRSPLASGRHDACLTAICRRASSVSPCLLRCPPSAHRLVRTVCRHPSPSRMYLATPAGSVLRFRLKAERGLFCAGS